MKEDSIYTKKRGLPGCGTRPSCAGPVVRGVRVWRALVPLSALGFTACATGTTTRVAGAAAPDHERGAAEQVSAFGQDVDFLRKHTKLVVLSDSHPKAQVAVAPEWQGRVMTSTAGAAKGLSFGWINRTFIEKGELTEHINVFGGEDRFWMGPEGGQFSIFFAPGVPFDLEHWYTPAPFDTEPFDVVDSDRSGVRLRKQMRLKNMSGTEFEVSVDREVRLLDEAEAWAKLGMRQQQGVELVAYESNNRITNAGKHAWKKETGLLSVWILGMFQPSPKTTVVLPFVDGPESELGPIVNDAYFGKVPADRLKVQAGTIFFRGDGEYRSKIGLSAKRARPVAGSYDAGAGALTIVQFTLPEGKQDYVNSMWEMQDHPYAGDVSNSYNDGPPSPGAPPLGPFYELESSSPAAALAPGQALTHTHRTLHLVGAAEALDQVAKRVLGVDLATIQAAFH